MVPILLNIDMKERMKHYNVSGLSMALLHKGQVRMAEGFGILEAGTNKKVDRHSIFNACSISKFLTALLVLKLVEQGILDLDEDIENNLVSWRIPHHEWTNSKKVTLRALLSHQSGITDPAGSFPELDSTGDVPAMLNLLEGTTPYCKEPVHIVFEPGSDFHYSDAGYCVIQQLLEDVTGTSFELLMNELLFEPLNIKNTTILQSLPKIMDENFACGHHKNGNLIEGKYPIYPYAAAAGVWTTPSDLAVIMIEVMNALNNKSKLGLSERLVKELISPQGCKEWTGLGVFLDGSEQQTEISSLGWGVGFQCMMVAYPYLESGVVIMTNTDLGVHQLKGIIGEIIHSTRPELITKTSIDVLSKKTDRV